MPNDSPPDDSYVPVRIGTLRGDDLLAFDLFAKVNGRYIRHTLKDDSLEQDRLSILKAKGVKRLFIPSASEDAYLKYLDEGLSQLKTSKDSAEKKAEVAHAALTDIAENATTTLSSKQEFQETASRFAKIADFILGDPEALQGFLKTVGVSEDAAQHSSTVAVLSVLLADRMGIKDRKELDELGLASLLHDVGKQIPGTALVDHTKAGAEFVAHRDFVSPFIMQLIRDHEEIGAGQGYPEKKNLELLPPRQQILNLVNHYDSYVMGTGKSVEESAKSFFIDKLGVFKLDFLNIFREVLASQKKK